MTVNVFDKAGAKVRLDDIPAEPPKGMTREKAAARFATLEKDLFELQDAMFGAKVNSVLVVLQGRDSAGKDGAIKHVVGCLNPRGVIVTSFGVPTPEERQLADRLSATLKRVAAQVALSPEVLATQRDLKRLVRGQQDIPPLQGWRREIIGQALLDTVQKG